MTTKRNAMLAMLEEPRLFEFLSAFSALCYGIAWQIVHSFGFAYSTHSTTSVFGPLGHFFALVIIAGGLLGVLATLYSSCRWRSIAAFTLFGAFGWYSTYFLFAVPPLFLQVVVYGCWSIMEGIIFVRVINNLGARWR